MRHAESHAEVSLLLTPVDGRNDHGSVLVDEDGRVLRFDEKTAGSEARHLNAGIYMIARWLLAETPSRRGDIAREGSASAVARAGRKGACFDRTIAVHRYRDARAISLGAGRASECGVLN